MADPKPLSADRPLDDPDYDRLGYAPFAKQLANSILKGCPSDGLVVALYGAWGTGKTTALKFVVHYLEQQDDQPIIMWFNPWWFAGQEDLVRRFFTQFQATIAKSDVLKKRGRKQKLASALSAFGSVLSEAPVVDVVPYVGESVKAAGKLAKAAAGKIVTTDIVELKEDIARALAKEAARIVIIVDDADRLVVDEIRQLFRLIKAVGDFPNVIYLLAFDREIAVRALNEVHGGAGDEYLEKIVQVPFELPLPDRLQLQTLLFDRLNPILDGTPPQLYDQHLWGNLYVDGIDPFIKKPRDIVRLTNALSVTYPAVCGEVHAVDFIGIETLRVFAPAAYSIVRANPQYFAGTGDSGYRDHRKSEERQFHETWLRDLGDKAETAKKLIERLFPRFSGLFSNTIYGDNSARAWRRQLRVAAEEVFPVYFKLAVSPGAIAAADVRQLLAVATDPGAVGRRLLELAHSRRADGNTRAGGMLSRLTDHADEVPLEAIPSMLRALFDVGDEIIRADNTGRSGFDLGDRYRIGWLVRALLRRLPAARRRDALRNAFANGAAVTAMLHEVIDLGSLHGKYNGNAAPPEDHVVDLATVNELETIVALRISTMARSGEIWGAPQPRALLDALVLYGDDVLVRQLIQNRIANDDALIAFLRLFVSRGRSQTMGDRIARTVVKLDPLVLWGLIEDVEALEPRVKELTRTARPSDDIAILNAFIGGLRTRRAGTDPRWTDRYDRDDDHDGDAAHDDA